MVTARQCDCLEYACPHCCRMHYWPHPTGPLPQTATCDKCGESFVVDRIEYSNGAALVPSEKAKVY